MYGQDKLAPKNTRPPRIVQMKTIRTTEPVPHTKYFKVGEEVVVEYASGFRTIGRVVEVEETKDQWITNAKPEKVKRRYIIYKDMRKSHRKPLGGQGLVDTLVRGRLTDYSRRHDVGNANVKQKRDAEAQPMPQSLLKILRRIQSNGSVPNGNPGNNTP